MKILSFGELGEITCYATHEVEQAQTDRAQGKKVTMGRPCTECGDLVFGELLDPTLKTQCAKGFHGNRKGVWV